MALIFENQSKCPLCIRVLNNEKAYIEIPSLTTNTKDRLYIFSDNGVHIDCLSKNKLKGILFTQLSEYNDNLLLEGARCIIDGKIIDNPRDVLNLGLLTSDKNEKLFKYNFVTIKKANIKEWKDRDEFIDLLNYFMSQGKWKSFSEFNYLEYLIEILS